MGIKQEQLIEYFIAQCHQALREGSIHLNTETEHQWSVARG